MIQRFLGAKLASLSIRGKLLLITLSVLMAGGLAGAWMMAASYRASMLDAAHSGSEALTSTVAEYCTAPLVFEDQAGATEILTKLQSQEDVVGARLLDEQGNLFASYVPQGPPRQQPSFTSHAPVVHQGRTIGRLEVETATTRVDQRIATTMRNIALASLALVVVCALLALRLQLIITGPLARLATAMRRVGSAGTLSERVTHEGDDEISALYERFNDMLDQLQARSRERDRSQAWLRALVDSLPDQVMVFDAEGCLIESLGESSMPQEDVRRLTVAEVFPEEAANTLMDGIRRTLSLGHQVRLEYEVEREERSQHYEAVLAPLSYEGDEEGARVLAVSRDVTERWRLQDQVMRSQKLQAVGQLAGGVAHDFNNLLTGIVGFAELLKHGRDPAMAAEQILQISDRAGDLVRQLLAFSRKAAPKRNVADMSELVKRVEGILRHTLDRRITLQVTRCEEPCLVRGDASQLESAVLNLAVNARDAMPEGGQLTISTRMLQLDAVATQALDGELSPGPYVEIAVADTGQGIPKDVLGRIFEPFYTTKEAGKGTGLGLSAVYGTVVSHRGGVQVQSQPGKGSVFRLFVPLADGEALAVKPTRVIEGTGCLLLVDDEEIVRETAAQLLQQLGYEVVSFAKPRDALAYFEKNHDGIDAAILDMVMPQMSGAELAVRMARIAPSMRMMLASGYLGLDDELPNTVPGLTVLNKPYSLAELASAVADLLSRPREEVSIRA